MPASVHPEDHDQSMVDVDGEQPVTQTTQDNEAIITSEENRITVVC